MADITKTMALLRDHVEVLIPESELAGVLAPASESSKALSMMKKAPNMSSSTSRVNVLSQMIVAGHINGDTGLKGISNAKWKNKYFNAEEIAVIVPIPDNVVADAEYDLWGMIKEQVPTAFGRAIDNAIFWGIDKPASHPACLLDQINAHGNVVTLGTSDLYKKMLGEDGAWSKVEELGYDVNGLIANVRMKAKLRGLLDTTGRPIFTSSLQDKVTSYTLDGTPITFGTNGAWNDSKVLMLGGAFNECVYSIRSDVSMKLFDSSVISDSAGNIIYNLMQQDMKAIRFTFRYAWQIPNPMTLLESDESVRFPLFALMDATGTVSTSTVTFTVTDGTDPIEGAYVDCGNIVLKTDASGEATLPLQDGSYTYKATTDDGSATGVITVDGSALNQSVTIVANTTTVSE